MDKKLSHKVGLALVGLVLLTSMMVAQGLIFKWETVEDAYISFRYARNLASGHGLVFNPGERVEGYTNFLWTVVLAAAAWLELDVPWVARWLGVAFASLGLVLTWRLALCVAEERNWPKALAWAAPTILACFPGWSFWAFSGMEGPLLTCLVLGFLLVGCKHTASIRTLVIAGVLGFLAAMTRWEIVLLWPIAVMVHLLDASRPISRRLIRATLLSLVLVIGFGIYFVCRLSYYGELMPNTYYAKMGADLITRVKIGMVYTGELALEWLLLLTFLNWLLMPKGHWTIVLALCLIVYGGYVTWVGGDFFPWLRFYLPIFPIAAILATDFIKRMSAIVPEAHTRSRACWIRFALTITLVLTICGIAARIDYLSAAGNIGLVNRWKKVGQWAKTSLPREYRLGLCPIGAIGYYSQHSIVDILGLTDYEVAHFGQIDTLEGVGHRRSHIDSILRRKPEVILGDALMFNYPPTVEETILQSRRRVLKKMYRLPKFQRLYRYEVAQVGKSYVPYWIDRGLEQASNDSSAASTYVPDCDRDN